ncbi:hypothetical protein HEP85_44765 [Streptomyces sp. RPA4-2]|uniref:hypothetical protein n=1 Tax=Streptomyces sp. RPA4-2 TaxID=2721244 RepID=UPI002001E457|nr:hypothetical protein [Streptomyces sp. RPA4-2]
MGVIGLTKSLAKEWGRYNVNAVAYGLLRTRLTEASAGGDASIDIQVRKLPVGVNPGLPAQTRAPPLRPPAPEREERQLMTAARKRVHEGGERCGPRPAGLRRRTRLRRYEPRTDRPAPGRRSDPRRTRGDRLRQHGLRLCRRTCPGHGQSEPVAPVPHHQARRSPPGTGAEHLFRRCRIPGQEGPSAPSVRGAGPSEFAGRHGGQYGMLHG